MGIHKPSRQFNPLICSSCLKINLTVKIKLGARIKLTSCRSVSLNGLIVWNGRKLRPILWCALAWKQGKQIQNELNGVQNRNRLHCYFSYLLFSKWPWLCIVSLEVFLFEKLLWSYHEPGYKTKIFLYGPRFNRFKKTYLKIASLNASSKNSWLQ